MSDPAELLHYSGDAEAVQLRAPHALVAFGGWVDAGSGGTGGVRHLISTLQTQKLAEIDPEEFYSFTDTRPLVSIVGAGERAVHWPRGEFHGAVLEHTNDLVLFVAPEPNLKWRTFASVMLDGLQRFGVQSMVCVGSIFGAVPHRGEVRMTGWANDDQLREALAKHKVMFTNYEGPTGFVTVLLAEAESRGLPAVAAYGFAPNYIQGVPNPRVSHALLQTFSAITGVPLQLGELDRAGRALLRTVDPPLHRPLPPLDGEFRLKGLSAPVDIVRDRWGIPHISAHDPLDAYFGQGFCHAQDRLWQMELTRRLTAGRLSEVFGERALDVDRFQRRLGLHRAAQREWETADGDLRDALRAYAAGVNACLEGLVTSKKLPAEFVLARFQPEPWQPVDTLGFGRYLAYSQTSNWESELVRSRLIARLGYAAAASLEPDVWQPDSDALPRLEDWGPPEAPEPGELPPIALTGGPSVSNAWVVSGARSSTGKPLLANDPHMFPRLPSVFYEAHLTAGGELNVAGAGAPGAPGIMIGHNRHIAWGITASMADAADLYVERLDPGDSRRTEFAGRWESGTVVREVIQIKGRAQPWIEDVLITRRHGPLITPTPSLADEHRPLAMRTMVLEAQSAASAILGINRAASWDEFRAAASRWGTDRKSTRLNSSHRCISYAVFCLKKKKKNTNKQRKNIGINRQQRSTPHRHTIEDDLTRVNKSDTIQHLLTLR